MTVKTLKTAGIITVTCLMLAACAGIGSGPSKPGWQSYGFSGAGADGGGGNAN